MRPIIAAPMQERQALAAVLRWARGAGWQRTGWNATWWLPATGATVALRQDLLDRRGMPVTELLIRREGAELPTFVPVRDVREAVNVLVALRVLPPHLSSVYTAGYGAGWRGSAMRPLADAERLSGRLMRYAQLVGAVQVAAYCTGADDTGRVREVREALAAAGFGNPFDELAQALAEERLTVGGGSR